MDKLKQETTAELACRYYDQFGLPAESDQKDSILAALYYGKRITYLTQEEINSINEI